MQTAPLHIGCASGFSGDRTDGAGPVIDQLIALGGGYLIFETLAERTLALAQLARNEDAESGYEPLLDELMTPILERVLRHGIRIVSNFGAANPQAAARRIARLAQQAGLPMPRIAVIHGDSLDTSAQRQILRQRLGEAFDDLDIVSANVYLGAHEIADALRAGAQIVVAGRVADPSLAVGPAIAHFNWQVDDWVRLGRATMAGHLLECGTQVSGGYFSIPGLKDVDGLDRTGFPIATLDADGHCTISKPPGTGGRIDACTVKEQLLYEVHDPSRYLTPDVIADISQASVEETAPDHVRVTGITGHPRPDELKVNVCHHNGWLAEAEISYAGIQAEARAHLAADIVQHRMGPEVRLRKDLIGVVSILDSDDGQLSASRPSTGCRDIRLRLAMAHHDRATAQQLLREVNALYTCGPAGGGGVRTTLRRRLNTISCTIAREALEPGWFMLDTTTHQAQS